MATTWTQVFSDKSNYTLKLTVNETGTSVSNNTSTVTYSLVMESTGFSGYSDYTSTARLKIGSTQLPDVTFTSFNAGAASIGTKTLFSGATTIQHSSDGTGSVTFVAKVTVNGDGGVFSPGTATISKSLTLTTIARQSTVSVASGTHYVGSALTISVSRASSSFTHTLRYVIGNKSGTIASNVGTSRSWTPAFGTFYNASSLTGKIYCKTFSGSAQVGSETSCDITLTLPISTVSVTSGTQFDSAVGISVSRKISSVTHTLTWAYGSNIGTIASSVGTSYSWTPASSTFGPYIPTATSMTLTIRCQSYGGGYALGNPTTATVSLTLPSTVKPDISNAAWAAIAAYNTGAAAILSRCVQNFSRFRITFDSSKITQAAGATFDHFAVLYNGTTTNVSGTTYTSGVLNVAGSVSCTVYAYDSRGRYASDTRSITVRQTYKPKLTNPSVYRSTSGGTESETGSYFHVAAGMDCAEASYGNSVTATISHKRNGGSYTTDDSDLTSITSRTYGGALSTTSSYTVRIVLTDALGQSGTYTFDLPTASVSFNIKDGGKGAAFFGYSNTDGELTVNGNIRAASGYDIKVGSDSVLTTANFATKTSYISGSDSVTWTLAANTKFLLILFGGTSTTRGVHLINVNASGTVGRTEIGGSSTGYTITAGTNSLTIANTSTAAAYAFALIIAGSIT